LQASYPVPQRLLDLRRSVPAQLMSDAVAERILDGVGKADRPEAAFQLSELYARLTRDIWSELAKGGDISASRRELQRDHVNRLANALLRQSGTTRADARSLQRVQALQLQAKLDKALKRGGTMGAETRAHLELSADMLSQALSAKVQRSAVSGARPLAAPGRARPGGARQPAPRSADRERPQFASCSSAR
jgi:hypothetical protein